MWRICNSGALRLRRKQQTKRCLLHLGVSYGYTFKEELVKIDFAPFWKEVYPKRKEFAPPGSKFFPFRVDPFSEGTQ